ncbi:hypothetical protein MiSe_94270 [Microseira wollei NIES-4236]|uniref:Uncharacterized protein n=1 Tax=Microseira wollei NIES-4236 TaxID=2530354 RepID=A0AAV3XS73_9CYAN|nr:hypothetical protein MiSe_94270 [Microseira wollei NIES-4236]
MLLEIARININNKINTATATAILNTMVEVGSVKTTTVANYHAAAVLDYLRPQLRQSVVEVTLTFTPGDYQDS